MKNGVYVGRFSPMHKGHEQVARAMLKEHGLKNCLIIIGSANNTFSLRHFFSYVERRQFIQAVFPKIRIAGLPDFGSDAAWLTALDDLLAVAGFDPRETIFYGGAREDIQFFLAAGRNCHVISRFSGKQKDVSATKVRDCLIHNRANELKELLSPRVRTQVTKSFSRKWDDFRKI